MRKIDFISRPLPLAEPVTVAILITTSLMRLSVIFGSGLKALLHCWSSGLVYLRFRVCRLFLGVRDQDLGFLHVPGTRGAALGAQAAVHAQVLVLDHHPARLRQGAGDEEGLFQVLGGRRQALPELLLAAVRRDGQAVHRADVDAGVALDAELVDE